MEYSFGLRLGLLLQAFGPRFLSLFIKGPVVVKADMKRLAVISVSLCLLRFYRLHYRCLPGIGQVPGTHGSRHPGDLRIPHHLGLHRVCLDLGASHLCICCTFSPGSPLEWRRSGILSGPIEKRLQKWRKNRLEALLQAGFLYSLSVDSSGDSLEEVSFFGSSGGSSWGFCEDSWEVSGASIF